MEYCEDHMACQLPSWYPTFSRGFPGRKKGLTFRSCILDVPTSFRTYLDEDGVRLPRGTRPSSCLGCKSNRAIGDGDDHDESWSADSSQTDANEETETSTKNICQDENLKELTDKIEQNIKELGGIVIPKLNWSAPKDAIWINEGKLQCKTAGDIYLLLKSSDFVSSDLALLDSVDDENNSKKKNNRIQLVLRKWANLYESQEFRCFVRENHLVAVSQRHADQHFEHLTKEKDEILELINDFLQEHVIGTFSGGRLSSFVVDVYVDRHDRVWIVDFNVWGDRTDSLLFTWEELQIWHAPKENEIRVIETEKQVRPHPLNNFRAPVDTVNIASITGGDANSFKAFMDLCRNEEDESTLKN